MGRGSCCQVTDEDRLKYGSGDFFFFLERMGYIGFVFGRVLVITYLIIHECLRHHCSCSTSEIGPTPLSAASICSYRYVNALSHVAYMQLPFTDGRGVICGS